MIMQKTTIMLPDGLRTQAIRKAHQSGLSLGEVIRTALEKTFQQVDQGRKEDSFWADERIFTGSGRKDMAEKHDDYLYGGKSDLH